MSQNQVTGNVKWFSSKNGYGFITVNEDGNSRDVFVHSKSIKATNATSLADGEEVLFDIVEGPKGSEARNVTGPNGGDVVGGKTYESNGNRYGDNNRGGDRYGGNNDRYQSNGNGNGNFRGRGRGFGGGRGGGYNNDRRGGGRGGYNRDYDDE